MCIMSSPKQPKIEKVAPAPQAITPTETGATNERIAAETEKNRKKKGFAATRLVDDRSVLTDTAQGNMGRQTLG